MVGLVGLLGMLGLLGVVDSCLLKSTVFAWN